MFRPVSTASCILGNNNFLYQFHCKDHTGHEKISFHQDNSSPSDHVGFINSIHLSITLQRLSQWLVKIEPEPFGDNVPNKSNGWTVGDCPSGSCFIRLVINNYASWPIGYPKVIIFLLWYRAPPPLCCVALETGWDLFQVIKSTKRTRGGTGFYGGQ